MDANGTERGLESGERPNANFWVIKKPVMEIKGYVCFRNWLGKIKNVVIIKI